MVVCVCVQVETLVVRDTIVKMSLSALNQPGVITGN